MKHWLGFLVAVVYNLIFGAIFVTPDFSSPVPRLVLHWLVRLLVAVGFAVVYRILAKVREDTSAEHYSLIEREGPKVEPEPAAYEVAFPEDEAPPPAPRWKLTPATLVFAGVWFLVVAAVLHLEILCKVAFVLIGVFLWMPNPWQASADQPELYVIAPRRD
jgi:hypothetical protein